MKKASTLFLLLAITFATAGAGFTGQIAAASGTRNITAVQTGTGDLRISPDNPAANTQVKFSISGSFDGCTYSWDFGDGTTNDSKYPTIVHAYSKPGTYRVKASSTCGGASYSQVTVTK